MTDLQYTLSAPASGRDVTAVMGRRILAWFVDLLLYFGVAVAIFAALADYVEIPSGSGFLDACEVLRLQDSDAAAGCVEFGDRAYLTSNADNGIQTLASFGYFAFFVLLQGIAGGSPGKLVTGLRVVDASGNRAGVGRSIGRTLLWVVDAAPWFLPLVGLITGLTSTGHRRVGDMAAGTYVISRGDVGQPVTTGAGVNPPAQGPWGAPPPQWTPQAPPPGGSAAPPPPIPGTMSPSVPPTAPPPTGPPAAAAPPPTPGPSVADLAPDVSGVPDEQPAPPPVPDNEPPTWSPPSLDDVAPVEPPTDVGPAPEIDGSVDEAAPELAPDDDWRSGPEASAEGSAPPAESAPEVDAAPEMPSWDDPSPTPDTTGDSWAPPTTPASDIGEAENTSPTAGPAPFAAPGADPVADAPSAPEPAPRPPPQWDQARNTYIQWEPSRQQWLQWDDGAQRWKDIDT